MSSSLDEFEVKLKNGLINKLLSFREAPENFIKDLETFKITLETLNREKQSIAELDSVIKTLKGFKGVQNLKVSEGLCKLANDQIAVFLASDETEFNQMTVSNKDTAVQLASKRLKNFGRIEQIQDTTNEEKRFFSRIFITNSDKDKKNKKIILNNNLKYFGIAVRKKLRTDNHYLVNILFSDHVDELPENNIDDSIIDEINALRVKSDSILNIFSQAQKKILDSKPNLNGEQINKFYEFLQKGKKLKALVRHPILDEMALTLLQHSSEKNHVDIMDHKDGVYIPQQESIESIAHRFLQDFNNVENFIIQAHPQNRDEVIEKILFSGRKHDNSNFDNIDILLRENLFENIGCSYEERENPKTKEKTAFISIILMDSFSALPQVPYLDQLKDEVARLRKDPKSFVDDVNKFSEKHSFKYSDSEKFKSSVEKVAQFLKSCDYLPDFKYNQNLHDAAHEYCHFIKTSKNQSFYEEEEELLRIRLSHYIENTTHAVELVNYSIYNPTEMIISILIKDAEKELQKKNPSSTFASLLGKNFKFFGACERYVREKSLVCIILTDSAKPKVFHDKNFKNDLIQDLKYVRRYPRSYMKFVDSEYNPFKPINSKSSSEDILLDFLSNTRSFEELIEQKRLHEAAQKYVYSIINENEDYLKNDASKFSSVVNKLASDKNVVLKSENKETLRKLLEATCWGFTNVFNIVENDFEDLQNNVQSWVNKNSGNKENKVNEQAPLNSKDFLIHLLKDESNRLNLFSKSANFFGICIHEQRKLINIIVTDEFSEQDNLFDYSKVWQGKAPRPDLTDDEINQIERDFRKLDVSNIGKIFPSLILRYFDEKKLYGMNFIYYEALKKFDVEEPESSAKGINREKFVEIVRVFLGLLSVSEYTKLFACMTERHRLKILEPVHFKILLEELNFKFNEDEVLEVFKDVCYPEQNLNQKKFNDIMVNLMEIAKTRKPVVKIEPLIKNSLRARGSATNSRSSLKF